MARKMAKKICVLNRPNGKEREMLLEIDGEEFPYFTAVGGWHVTVAKDSLPGVTITIVAESVEVDHSLKPTEQAATA